VFGFQDIRKGASVSFYQLEKRFGVTAVKMGFITAAQLHEAMRIQLDEDLLGLEHRLIGRILLERAHISSNQIREVLRQMRLPVQFCINDGDIDRGFKSHGKVTMNHPAPKDFDAVVPVNFSATSAGAGPNTLEA
jgi:hypothetical protein